MSNNKNKQEGGVLNKHQAHQMKMRWQKEDKIARREAHHQKRWRKPRPYCGNLL